MKRVGRRGPPADGLTAEDRRSAGVALLDDVGELVSEQALAGWRLRATAGGEGDVAPDGVSGGADGAGGGGGLRPGVDADVREVTELGLPSLRAPLRRALLPVL